MARRMFSDRITSSAKFLKMPATAQMLFFHLGMKADDEGVVEGFIIMRMAGATEEDLRLLEEKGFVKILNEDLVTYIENWKEHNLIKGDRLKTSMYHKLLKNYLDTCRQSGNTLEPNWNQNGNSLETKWKQSGTKMEPNRKQNGNSLEPNWNPKISKDKLSKDKLREDNTAATRESNNLEYTGAPVDNSLQQPPLATKLSGDESFAEVVKLYQDNIHPIANEVEADELVSLFDDYGEEWLTRAIKEAALSNARTIKYIVAVLENWKKRGVPDPWNHKPPGKAGSPPKGKTQSDRAAEVYRGAMELLEAGG